MQPDRARIGLVEDDPVMGGSIVQRLELEGWKVTWWQSGLEAIPGIEGLAVEGSAESLWRQVTSSVVKPIFMVIVMDGLFAMFFAAIRY